MVDIGIFRERDAPGPLFNVGIFGGEDILRQGNLNAGIVPELPAFCHNLHQKVSVPAFAIISQQSH